jgi:hypothetical protein
LDPAVDNTAFCRLRIDKSGAYCAYDLGGTACRERLLWEDATSL